jgi:hypothetical protein
MLIRKGFKYRVYPTPTQEKRLLRWESALRTDKRYPTAFDQMKELTCQLS